MNVFLYLWYLKVFCNNKQFLEAEKKLIYIIHLKAFLFKLNNVLLLKYMCVLFSHKLLHMILGQDFCDLLYTLKFKMVNLDIS